MKPIDPKHNMSSFFIVASDSEFAYNPANNKIPVIITPTTTISYAPNPARDNCDFCNKLIDYGRFCSIRYVDGLKDIEICFCVECFEITAGKEYMNKLKSKVPSW